MRRRAAAAALALSALAAPAAWADPPPPADTDVPHVTGTKLSRTTFAVGDAPPALVTPARAPVATIVSYTLSEESTVGFRVERATTGRVRGSLCVRATKANSRARHCTRWVSAGTFDFHSGPGRQNVRFEGRFDDGHALRPGKHRITLTPTDLAGNRGAFQRRPFTIAR